MAAPGLQAEARAASQPPAPEDLLMIRTMCGLVCRECNQADRHPCTAHKRFRSKAGARQSGQVELRYMCYSRCITDRLCPQASVAERPLVLPPVERSADGEKRFR